MTEREELAKIIREHGESGVYRGAVWLADVILESEWLKDRDGEHYDAGREDCEQEYKQSAGDFISGSWR